MTTQNQPQSQKEYWVNVWSMSKTFQNIMSTPHRRKIDADWEVRHVAMNFNFGCPYRIHVKMKPCKDQHHNHIYIKFTEKDMDRLWDW